MRSSVHRSLIPVAFVSLALLGACIDGCGSVAVPTSSPPANTQPGISGNQRPSFTFLIPERTFSVSVGTTFITTWIDSDPDDSAVIDLVLDQDTNHNSGNELIILAGRQEDSDLFIDDSFEVDTTNVPVGNYILRALINDGVNPEVIVEAPGVVNVVRSGTAPLNFPPRIRFTAPTFDRSVANGDAVVFQWEDEDPDNNALIILKLDFDNNPKNDDPFECSGTDDCIILANTLEDPDPDPADPGGPNALGDTHIAIIDVNKIPTRSDGEPYFVKATVWDETFNAPIHAYAAGQLFVLSLAEPNTKLGPTVAGTVDLGQVGRVISGTTFQGFNSGDWLGWRGRTVGDFDGDTADDFVLLARFGKPLNDAPLGQAYITYGLPPVAGTGSTRGERFGGKISVNQISNGVSGVLVDAPHEGLSTNPLEFSVGDPTNVIQGGPNLGLTDVGFIADDPIVAGGGGGGVSGDGLPEILFGIPHTDGIGQTRDDDPGDADVDDEDTTEFNENFGCYSDPYANNLSTASPGPTDDPFLANGRAYERLGVAVMLYSSNRDNDGAINPNRLEGTSLSLEDVGQQPENRGALGATDPVVEGGARPSGARFQVGLYDHLCDDFGCNPADFQGPILGEYGRTVDSLPDMNNDQVSELIISGPRNEMDLAETFANFGFSTQVASRVVFGSIQVYPGQNFRANAEDFTGGGSTNSTTPWIAAGSAACADTGDTTRNLFEPGSSSEIFAENAGDRLGYARFAGDFDADGVPDIAMGAPMATASLVSEAGKAYVLFGTPNVDGFGNIYLDSLNTAQRPPVMRIMGEHEGDHLGIVQGLQQDFNGDGIDDTVIGSGDYDCPSCDTATCPIDEQDCGAVAILFGDTTREIAATSDYKLSEIGSPALPGLVFYGSPGDKLGGGSFKAGAAELFAEHGVSGSGFYNAAGVTTGADFNGDGFGDLLIAAPGAVGFANAQPRQGAVYLVFGREKPWDPIDQRNNIFTLAPSDGDIGTSRLPGIVFVSPYEVGTLDEAAPLTVGFLGDVNADGFDDAFIGNPLADFVSPLNPLARRKDAGEGYLIYGSNFGCNNPNNWPSGECFGPP